MSAYASRILDVGVDSPSSPISGLKGAPTLPFEECVDYAKTRDPLLAFESLDGNLLCAQTFAEELQDPLLTQDEVAAIHLYTQQSPWYPTLNERLRERDRELLKPFFPYIRLLLTAMYKLPQYTGTLFRGVKKDLRPQFKPNSKKIWWAFGSSATRLDVLQSEQFLGKKGDRTLFQIDCKTGVDIQRYSAFSNEAEVLLSPMVLAAAAIGTPVSASVVPMAAKPMLMAGPAYDGKAVSAFRATETRRQMAVHKPPVVLYFHEHGCFQFDRKWTTVKTPWNAYVHNRICTMSYDGTECVVLMLKRGQLSVYNPVTSKLSQPLPELPKLSFADTTSLVHHRQVLYVFGWDEDQRGIYALQPSATQWQRVCTTNAKHQSSAVGVIGDKIYISDEYSTESYDTVTNKCVVLSGKSARDAGSCVYGGKLYVAGGSDHDKYFSTLRCYDPVKDKWTQLADMPTTRCELSLVVCQDRLWAIGGGVKQFLKVVESYDVAQNKWRSEHSLPSAAVHGGAVVI